MRLQSYYDSIYLSPHLDDAVLSCGGQIYQKSASERCGDRTASGIPAGSTLIVTVMAGDPSHAVSSYAQGLQDRWRLPSDAGAGRRAEDIEACAIVGADALHWPIPDCIYRVHPETGSALYLSDEELFGEIHPAEEALVETIASHLQKLPPCNQVFAPLCAGHHVDHRLVTTAARTVWADRLWFYEDYPYAQKSDALAAALNALQSDFRTPIRWENVSFKLDAETIDVKIEAILAYRSQISTFWTDPEDLRRQIERYADQVGGERLWYPRPG